MLTFLTRFPRHAELGIKRSSSGMVLRNGSSRALPLRGCKCVQECSGHSESSLRVVCRDIICLLFAMKLASLIVISRSVAFTLVTSLSAHFTSFAWIIRNTS